MQTDLITKVYLNEHLTHSCVGMPQGLQVWRGGGGGGGRRWNFELKRNVPGVER